MHQLIEATMMTATFALPDGELAAVADRAPMIAQEDASSSSSRDAEFERDALPWLDDVYRFALSLTRDESDADDVLQETYLRAYRSWHTFILGTDCRRWLFTICRNVFLRSRERQRPTVDLEDGEQDAVAAGSVYHAAREKGYDDLYARLDLAPALRDALDDLNEPFRSAVILVDVEDMTYEAAAEVMGVPIGTVRSRLFRGRRLLQEKLLTVAEDLGFVPASAGGTR
jgi:RNA polymerase sigma-70 factor (ECF subfamily)